MKVLNEPGSLSAATMRVFTVLGGLFLLTHFAILYVYADPLRAAGASPPLRTQWYAYPFFHQSWNLFVPAPSANYRFFATCRNRNGKVELDLLERIGERHRQNPLRGYGGLLVALTNSIHQFERNTPFRGKLNGPVPRDRNFDILERFGRAFTAWDAGCAPASCRVALLVEEAAGNRVYFR